MSPAGTELPPERAGTAPPADLAAIREQIAAHAPAWLAGIEPAPVRRPIDGIACLRLASSSSPRATVLHLHGGAFRIGAPEVVAPFAAALAARCGVDVVCPAYRLAPDHPFPAGLNDAWTVLEALAADASGPVILSGDSAGGGLAAGLAALAAERGVALAGLVLLSPWLDLTVSAPAYADNAASDPLFSAAAASQAAAQYLQGTDPTHTLASPLFASLAEMPPTLIVVGDGEVLIDDARRFEEALENASRPVTLSVVAGMEHVALIRDHALTGAAQAFDAVATFIDRRVSAAA